MGFCCASRSLYIAGLANHSKKNYRSIIGFYSVIMFFMSLTITKAGRL